MSLRTISKILFLSLSIVSVLSGSAETQPNDLVNGFPAAPGLVLFDLTGVIRTWVPLPGMPTDVDILPNRQQLVVVTLSGEFLILSFNGAVEFRTTLDELNDVDVLNQPNEYLLTSRSGRRVFFYNPVTGAQRNLPYSFSGPTDADLLPNGHFLVCDAQAGKVVEITWEGSPVWSFDQGLKQPMDALRLDDGNTWISDFDNHRILVVSSSGMMISEHIGFNHPIKMTPLPGGEILVADGDQQRLVAVSPDGTQRLVRDRLNFVQAGMVLEDRQLYACVVQNKFPPPGPLSATAPHSGPSQPLLSNNGWKIPDTPYLLLLIAFSLWGLGFLSRPGGVVSKTCILSAYGLVIGTAYHFQLLASANPPYHPAPPFWAAAALLTLFSFRDAGQAFRSREQWPQRDRRLGFPFSPQTTMILLMWPVISVVCQYYHLRIGPLGFPLPWYVPMISWGIGLYFLFSPWFRNRDILNIEPTAVFVGTVTLAVPFTTGSVGEESLDGEGEISQPQPVESKLSEYWANTSVILVLILAASLYIIGATSVPTDVHGDEGEVALHALKVRDSGQWNWFNLGDFYLIPELFFLIPGWVMWLFGDNLFGARMAGALIGIGTIPVFYLLARRILHPTPAALATFLFATTPYFIHFSRIGIGYNQTTLLTTAALYFFVRGLQDAGGRSFALAGFFSGLGFFSYQATHLLLPLLLASLALLFLTRNISFRFVVKAAFAFLLTLWVTISPLVGNYLIDSSAFLSRANSVSLFSEEGRNIIRQDYPEPITLPELLQGQIERSWLAPISMPDRSPYLVNHRYGGMLAPIPAILFVAGLLFLLLKLRNAWAQLLLFWTFSTLTVGSAFTNSAPAYQRLVGSIPYLLLIAAPILHGVIRHAARAGRWSPRMRGIVICAVAGILLVMSMHRYFHQIMSVPQFLDDSTRVAHYLHDAGPTRYTYFFGHPYFYFNYGNIRFLAPEARGEDVLKPDEFLAAKITRRGPVTFLLIHGNMRYVHELRRLYPGGKEESHTDFTGGNPFITYEVNF